MQGTYTQTYAHSQPKLDPGLGEEHEVEREVCGEEQQLVFHRRFWGVRPRVLVGGLAALGTAP